MLRALLPAWRVPRGPSRVLKLGVLALCLLPLGIAPAVQPRLSEVEPGPLSDLQQRARSADDLKWLASDTDVARLLGDSIPATREALLQQKQARLRAGDETGVARVNALLSAAAFARASRVAALWLDRRDPATGLLPTSLEPEGQVWTFHNAGADLYSHLTIATALFTPNRYHEMLEVLASERARAPGLPDDLLLGTGQPLSRSHDERIFGAAEYAKDGLLPLLERLGPEPWLGRLTEIGDAVLEASTTPTRNRGAVPADSAEINGDMLQVYSRLYWATGNERFMDAADRIAETYLQDVLPNTTYLPPNRWDFVLNEPLDQRRFRLSDHGNEVLTGLIEWHLIDTLQGNEDVPRNRRVIRRMLDRVLEKGRNQDGMWLRVIEIPSGKVVQEGLTDSWGYIFQAYLTQAYIESIAVDGDPKRAQAYREAAAIGLRALAKYRFYPWERGAMDGYADAIEGALYLLNEQSNSAAEAWVDEQIAVLYGFQNSEGRVLDEYLDGNFIRTSLLYGFWLTQGVRLDPWEPTVFLGSAVDGECLTVAMYSPTDWRGHVMFDIPRHRLFTGLPADYPRLNKWPQWYVVEPDRTYLVSSPTAAAVRTGDELAGGLPVEISAGATPTLRVCPSG